MDPDESNVWIALLSSDINLELLRLFHTTPKLTYSGEEIVKQIGRTKDEIQHGLNDLVKIRVLKRTGELESFCLDENRDREIQDEISRYLLNGVNWAPRSYCERFC